MAFPAGWSHKWPIAINADSVISSPVSDWPCLITDAHIPAGAWALMQATGADLRFSLDEAGATELYYDAPRLSVAGESAHLYVRVPSLASTADTTIYGWVGNAEATAPSAAWMQNTYPADVAAWWPMEEGAGTTVGDRTSNGNNGTMTNMDPATDWVQQADGSWVLDFDGSNDHVLCGAVPPFTNLTILATVNITDLGAHRVIAGNKLVWSSATGCYFEVNRTSKKLLFASSGAAGIALSSVVDFPLGVQTHAAATLSGTQATVYINGAPNNTGAVTAYAPSAADWHMGIFANGTDSPLLGLMDHCSLYTRALSPAEIAAHHLMYSDPASFATAGELVAVGGASRAYFGTRNLGAQLLRRTGL